MTALLTFVALVTLGVLSFAAVVAIRIVRERRIWNAVRRERHRSRQSKMVPCDATGNDEDVGRVALCLQVWLDEQWKDRFG